MICSEFENIVNDLVRAKMIDAASRAASMAHVETCGRCAARLADERALSAGLKSLAASDESLAAPPGVEAALLKAFRDRVSSPPAPRLPVMSKTWPRWDRLAAAAILIAFGFVIYRAIKNEPQIDDKVVKENSTAPQPSVNANEQVMKENGATKPPRGSRAIRPRGGNRLRLNKPIIRENLTTYARDNEYTTDFFPLTYSDDQRPMESGDVIRVQVIRVQMPRPALIALGLPVNIERADEPVKADLLIDEGGLARAIRFVR